MRTNSKWNGSGVKSIVKMVISKIAAPATLKTKKHKYARVAPSQYKKLNGAWVAVAENGMLIDGKFGPYTKIWGKLVTRDGVLCTESTREIPTKKGMDLEITRRAVGKADVLYACKATAGK